MPPVPPVAIPKNILSAESAWPENNIPVINSAQISKLIFFIFASPCIFIKCVSNKKPILILDVMMIGNIQKKHYQTADWMSISFRFTNELDERSIYQ